MRADTYSWDEEFLDLLHGFGHLDLGPINCVLHGDEDM